MRASPNYFTTLLRDIRANLIAQAIIDSLPEPTDEEIELEIDRVFTTLQNRIFGNFILRRSAINDSWLIENILFAPSVAPVVLPLAGSSFVYPSAGGLVVSANTPIVYMPVRLLMTSEAPVVTIT